MPARSRYSWLLNSLGFLAYLSCLFQWAFVLLPFLPGMLESDVFHTFVTSDEPEVSVNIPPLQVLPGWLVLTVAGFIVLIVIGVTVLAFARLPRAVGKTGQKLTRSVAEQVVPIVTHHARLPERKRRALTARIVFDVKLAIVALPLLILMVVPLPETTGAPQVLMLVASLTAGWSLFLFCLQAVVARASKAPLDRLW